MSDNYSISELNKHFESRIRIGILSILQKKDWVPFSEFKKHLKVSDGNLSSHLKALHYHRYIKLKRKFAGTRPQTSYALTTAGKRKFVIHSSALQKLLRQ